MMSYSYEKREGTHGVAYGAFAEIKQNANGTLDTSVVPSSFTGLRSVSFETTQDSQAFYADNVEHIRLSGAKATEGTITTYQIPKKFMTDHLGFKETSNGGLTDTGTQKNFIWQYIETVTDEFGETARQLTVYYNVKASAPTAESATDEDSAEIKEIEIPCTASPNNLVKDADNNSVTYFQLRETSTNTALFTLAESQIILPTTAVSGE